MSDSRIIVTLLLVGAAVALAVPARAQEARPPAANDAPASPVDPSNRSSDAPNVDSHEPAGAAHTPPPPDPVLVEARERQARGAALLEAGDPNGALAEFERVYALLDGHPRQFIVLANVGRAQQALGHYDEAMAYFERYLGEAPADVTDRVTVAAAVEALRGLLGTLAITTNVAHAEVWMDNRRIGEAPGELLVPGGRHSIELRAEGHSPAREEIEIAARATERLALSLEPLGEASGLDPAVFFSGLVLTGVSGAAAASFGGAFLARQTETQARIADGSAADTDLAAEREIAFVADVLSGVTAALGVTTLILGLLTQWEEPEDLGAQPTLALTPGGAAIGARGRFE